MTVEQLTAVPVPAGLSTTPVAINRYSAGNFPKRNSVILTLSGDHWEFWRVAKVESRNASFPRIYLVDVDALPTYGDGSAAAHYGTQRVRYWQDTVGGIAQKGARLLIRDSQAETFLADYVAQAKQHRVERDAARLAWSTGPGGVAERIEQRVSSLRWRAKEMRNDAGTLDRIADELEDELTYLRQHAGDKP